MLQDYRNAQSVLWFDFLKVQVLYLQNYLGTEPCPMCIVQRYAMIGVIVWCLLGLSEHSPIRTMIMSWLVFLTADDGDGVLTAKGGGGGGELLAVGV